MKALILLLSLTSSVFASSSIEMITGDEAYALYKKLPGKACQEYRIAGYVVYTKYQTNSCSETQTDDTKWMCTTQFAVKNGKTAGVISADCSRQIN